MTAPFWHLVRQDLIRAWPKILMLIGVFTAWLIYFGTTIQDGMLVFAAVIQQMILILVAVAIWRSMQSFSLWSTSRMHLLLSLPIPGVVATGATFMVLWVEVILYGLAVFGGAAIVSSIGGMPVTGLEGEALVWTNWLAVFLRYFVFIAMLAAILIAITQFSWLLGRSFRAVHGPVSILTFIGLSWIFLRLGMAVGNWEAWEIPFTFYSIAEGYEARGLAKLTLNLAPLLGMLGLSGVLLWLGSRLFEQRIEV